MGLNINTDKTVSFDDSHQNRVNTSMVSNPTYKTLGDIHVTHVFRRNKTGDKDRDGNPLIYALKEMKGYRINPEEHAKFFSRAAQIVSKFRDELQADYVMPLPSSKPFCREFAQFFSDVTMIDYLAPDFMRKKTVDEVLLEHRDSPVSSGLNKYAKRNYNAQLKAWRGMGGSQLVSMKELDASIRHCFNPLVIDDVPHQIRGSRIVLIDDLMSSGASLISAASLMNSQGFIISRGVCFLSGL